MKKRCTTCSRCSRATGLTLVEVVAAIAILGTILVGVVLAKSRHKRQLARSELRLAAVRAADELIAGWWTGGDGVPVGATGAVPNNSTLSWQTRVVENEAIARLGARVVRVELHQSEQDQPLAEPDAEPVIAVDLVLPDPALEEANDASATTTPKPGPRGNAAPRNR